MLKNILIGLFWSIILIGLGLLAFIYKAALVDVLVVVSLIGTAIMLYRYGKRFKAIKQSFEEVNVNFKYQSHFNKAAVERFQFIERQQQDAQHSLEDLASMLSEG